MLHAVEQSVVFFLTSDEGVQPLNTTDPTLQCCDDVQQSV